MNQTTTDQEPSAWETLGQYLRRPSLLLSALGVTTLVLYSGALSFNFLWDDWPQIINSPILRSWRNLPQAFTSDLWYHVARHQTYYRPLFVAWSMLNYSLFGLRPWGWHLGAILLHVAAVAAVFWLARKLGLEYWTAALTALIFALHPVHIEPVVWISAASDTMVTLFVALAFVAFLNGRKPPQSRRVAWWLASLGLLACALLTKEMAVTFSTLVAIYAWLYPAQGKASLGRRALRGIVEAAPYAILTIGYALLRMHALSHAAPTHQSGQMTNVFRTLPLVISFYLKKLLLPVGLTGLYYTPYVTTKIVSQIVVPVLALAAAVGLLWYWARREGNSTVVFAGCWFLVGLAPALYLRNFSNGDFVRDRYVYLSSVGFSILLALGCRRLPSIKAWRAQTVQACAAGVLCIAYIGASLAQQVHWDSDLLVLVRGQSLYPDNPYTLLGLAAEYSARGANDAAIELTEKVAREHPEYSDVPFSLAENYIRAGKVEQGRAWLEKAIAARPDYATSPTGMAALAGLYGRVGDYKRAFSYCDEVLGSGHELYSALYNCGNVHLMAGQYKEAEELLMRASTENPELAEPKYYLGRALLEDGQNAPAQAYLLAAVNQDPTVWTYHYWLGWSLEQAGNVPAARHEYQQALQLNTNSSEAKMRLAMLATK